MNILFKLNAHWKIQMSEYAILDNFQKNIIICTHCTLYCILNCTVYKLCAPAKQMDMIIHTATLLETIMLRFQGFFRSKIVVLIFNNLIWSKNFFFKYWESWQAWEFSNDFAIFFNFWWFINRQVCNLSFPKLFLLLSQTQIFQLLWLWILMV